MTVLVLLVTLKYVFLNLAKIKFFFDRLRSDISGRMIRGFAVYIEYSVQVNFVGLFVGRVADDMELIFLELCSADSVGF